jgi:bacterioferritin (cytochrome b1)
VSQRKVADDTNTLITLLDDLPYLSSRAAFKIGQKMSSQVTLKKIYKECETYFKENPEEFSHINFER